jgi:hypothetical protein
MLATSVGGMKITAATENILIIAFCSMLMSPRARVEQEGYVPAEICRVIGKRRDVASQAFDVFTRVICVIFQRERQKAQQSREADGAISRFRNYVLRFSNSGQQHGQGIVSYAIAAGLAASKGCFGDRIHLSADILKHVGQSIDDGIEEMYEGERRVRTEVVLASGMSDEGAKWLRVAIAHRDQMRRRKHEGYRTALRLPSIRPGHDVCRQINCIAACIEPARWLYLGHFVARGYGKTNRCFDEYFLFVGRKDEVDPHGIGGQHSDSIDDQFDWLGRIRSDAADHGGAIADIGMSATKQEYRLRRRGIARTTIEVLRRGQTFHAL